MPCRFRRCVADQEPYCPVHEPEAILERVQRVIDQRLTARARQQLTSIHDDLFRDIRNTV